MYARCGAILPCDRRPSDRIHLINHIRGYDMQSRKTLHFCIKRAASTKLKFYCILLKKCPALMKNWYMLRSKGKMTVS